MIPVYIYRKKMHFESWGQNVIICLSICPLAMPDFIVIIWKISESHQCALLSESTHNLLLTILSSWGRLNTMHGAWKGGWQLGQISIEASKPFQKIDYVVFSASSFSFTQVIILSGNLVLDLIMLLTI